MLALQMLKFFGLEHGRTSLVQKKKKILLSKQSKGAVPLTAEEHIYHSHAKEI